MAKSCTISRCINCGKIITFGYKLCYDCNIQNKALNERIKIKGEFKGSLKYLHEQ